MDRRERNKRTETHTLPSRGFQEPSVVVEHVADISDRPYRRCAHVSNMCAGGGTPALTPGSVHTVRASMNYTFLFPFLPLALVFLCSTLLCRGKIAQLLLQRADLNSAAHCAVMGGRGMDRP